MIACAPGDLEDGKMPDTDARRASEDRYRYVAGDWDTAGIGTHCVDCYPGNCPLYVFVKDGRVVREELAGNLDVTEHGVPDLNPMGCQKGIAWSRQLDSPDRVLHPLRRAGERGEGRWERISWDEALSEIADAIIDAIEEVGPESVVYEGSPEIGAVIPVVRFMNLLGGTTLDVNASINDFWTGLQQTFGKFYFAPSVEDAFHADCLLIWHCNPAYTMIPTFHYLTEARYRGATVVLISPDVNPSHSHADYHVPVAHGTDAALALGMCQVILEEELADLDFVRSQTDLSLVVRTDTGEFLRESHVETGGRADRFRHWHPELGIVPADPASLVLDHEPVLEGRCECTLADGTSVTVEPLHARVRRLLDSEYTPEQVAVTTGVNPDTLRTLARLVAAGRTRIMLGAGVSKYFHGDLMVRAMMLLLALTGNWGKKGTGTSGWATGLFDGHTVAMTKTKRGVEGADAVIGAFEDFMNGLKAGVEDISTDELAVKTMWQGMAAATPMVAPAFFWYWHAGYRDRWNNAAWSDPSMTRSFDEYFDEAVSAGWPNLRGRMGPETEPRVLLEIAGNMLRRSRAGEERLLADLWPKLTKVVVVDHRMSQTALHADIVLPATQQYEKVAFNMPTPWTMRLAMTDRAVDPAGEARSEWEMLADLLRTLAVRAQDRSRDDYRDARGSKHTYASLWDEYTLGGALVDDESVADEMVRDAVTAGTLPAGSTLETFRAKGWTRYSGWGMMGMAKGQASPFPEGETHAPLRNHVELGHPYPTLTRRAQFLIDHPWYVEAGEDLPVHKDPPAIGGRHPFRLSGGHNRWSIHAMNHTNPVMLETHRGKPFVLVHPEDARRLGVADDEVVRIWNDVGEFSVNVRTSPAQRHGALTVYNGYEDYMFPGGKGPNEVEVGMVKWLHLVDGYGHLQYAPMEWQPVPFDRCVFVSVERA